jgi:hypothetical protein
MVGQILCMMIKAYTQKDEVKALSDQEKFAQVNRDVKATLE